MNKPVKIIYGNNEYLPKVLGLGFETIPIEEWVHEPNTNYLVFDEASFYKIRDTIPLGLRGAPFWLVAKMKRVGLNDGSNYIFTWSSEDEIADAIARVMDPEFETPHEMYHVPEFTLIQDIDEAVKLFEELTEMPLGTWFGYDYETKNFPDNTEFIITGLGIATTDHMYFIDYRFCMTDPKERLIDYECVNGVWNDEGLQRLNVAHMKFLDKHSKHCVVFNVNFELIATYRYTGKFYEYRDLNATNIMKQFGLWCNLKWTARYLMNINSWDDKFEGFTDAFDPKDESENRVADFDEDQNITKIYYDRIRARFDWISTGDIKEMVDHSKVSNDPFYIIPSRHLGYYCGLDSYNTLIGWLIELPNWNYVDSPDNHKDMGERLDKLNQFPIEDRFKIMSEAGLDAYCDGKIAESIVNNGGQLIDADFWRYGLKVSYSFLLHATTHLGHYYCEMMMERNSDHNDINAYSPIAQKLMKEGYNISESGYSLSKQLLTGRYYNNELNGSCDEDLVRSDWGDEVGQEILDTLWELVDDLEGVARRRKVHEYIGDIIDRELKLSEELLEKHEATVEYYNWLNTKKWYEEMPWYNVRLENYEDGYELWGEYKTLDKLFQDIIGELNINVLQSEIKDHVLHHNEPFRYFVTTVGMGYDWEIEDKYPRKSLHDDLNFFLSDEYLEMLPEEARNNIIGMMSDEGNIEDAGLDYFYKSLSYFGPCKYYYPKDGEKIMDEIRTGLITPEYELFSVMALLRVWAKYYKIKTYFEGTYYEDNINYNYLDNNWYPDFHPTGEFSDYKPMLGYPKFIANKQFSGRWSSNFHTIPSHNEVKKCTTSPEDAVFTYFDISAMEVRSIGYLSRDSKIIDLYEHKVDLYKFCARFMLGDDVWNSLDEEEQGDYRSAFKVVLLAYFYLRGARSLAPELGKSVEETQSIMDSLGKTFPEAIEFREYLSHYPLEHNGRLLTVFGEWIESDEEPYRQLKHGINTVIQGASAIMLVYGFYNLMRKTWEKGWKFRSIGYVHDSSQSYFDIDHFWEMNAHYYEHVTQFLWDRFRVRFMFDIMVGINYYDVSKLTQIDERTVQLKGSGDSINGLMSRFRKRNIKFEIVNREELNLDENDLLVTDIKDPLEDFIDSLASEPKFALDHSSYKVILRKLD